MVLDLGGGVKMEFVEINAGTFMMGSKDSYYEGPTHKVAIPRPFRTKYRSNSMGIEALGPVIVTLAFGIPSAIFTEAALSFLGIGIRPPEPSWGVMIEDGYSGIFADPLQVIFPAIAVALTMLSFTFMGDGLRDALDPRMKR